ncbi:MAG: hypothetical protein DRJ05_15955 [Bacteroidetes bacterium]|nr:MAG: hypothetical protein DRJ05_15955 [Bacteroidota bacterium]
MNINKIADVALQLNPHDRAFLAQTIWESLDEPFVVASDISEKETIAMAKQRDAEIEQGHITPLTHKELMDRLRK